MSRPLAEAYPLGLDVTQEARELAASFHEAASHGDPMDRHEADMVRAGKRDGNVVTQAMAFAIGRLRGGGR